VSIGRSRHLKVTELATLTEFEWTRRMVPNRLRVRIQGPRISMEVPAAISHSGEVAGTAWTPWKVERVEAANAGSGVVADPGLPGPSDRPSFTPTRGELAPPIIAEAM